MPLSKYFKNHGQQVMSSMQKAKGGDADAAKREFYATANKTGMKPGKRKSFGQKIGARD